MQRETECEGKKLIPGTWAGFWSLVSLLLSELIYGWVLVFLLFKHHANLPRNETEGEKQGGKTPLFIIKTHMMTLLFPSTCFKVLVSSRDFLVTYCVFHDLLWKQKAAEVIVGLNGTIIHQTEPWLKKIAFKRRINGVKLLYHHRFC